MRKSSELFPPFQRILTEHFSPSCGLSIQNGGQHYYLSDLSTPSDREAKIGSLTARSNVYSAKPVRRARQLVNPEILNKNGIRVNQHLEVFIKC
jgi:hypothetical protein